MGVAVPPEDSHVTPTCGNLEDLGVWGREPRSAGSGSKAFPLPPWLLLTLCLTVFQKEVGPRNVSTWTITRPVTPGPCTTVGAVQLVSVVLVSPQLCFLQNHLPQTELISPASAPLHRVIQTC